MLLSIQFPLADIRRFLQTTTGRIDRPEWPSPPIRPEFPENAPFVRGFGEIEQRALGGLTFWGEDLICNAANVIKWLKPNSYSLSRNGHVLPLEIAFRRFFFDGSAVGKYELGIASAGRMSFHFSAAETLDFVHWFLNHSVSVPVFEKGNRENKRMATTLLGIPRILRQSYLLATTRSSWKVTRQPYEWWAMVGSPLLFLQVQSPRESIALSSLQARTVTLDEWGVTLACRLLTSHGLNIPLWVLRSEMGYNKTVARQLRLCILRLHAEHECLRLILNSLYAGKIKVVRGSFSTEQLQSYLNEATRKLFRTSSTLDRLTRVLAGTDNERNYSSEDITTLAQSILERIWPGRIASLEAMMQQVEVRRNIARKIQNYNIEVNMSKYDIHGNQNVTVIDTLTLVSKDDGKEETVDQLLEKLSRLEAEVARRATTPEQKEAVNHVAEAKSEAEKGNRSGVIAKLKSAGKWVGEIAKEIGSSVIAKIIEGQLGLG